MKVRLPTCLVACEQLTSFGKSIVTLPFSREVRGVSVVPFRRLGARLPDLFCHCDQTSERFDENLHALLDSKINATVGDNDVATLFR